MFSVLAWGKFHGSLYLSQAKQGPQIAHKCVQNVTGLASPFPGGNPQKPQLHVHKSTTQISTDSGATNTQIEEIFAGNEDNDLV
jgi:hypothetical protein